MLEALSLGPGLRVLEVGAGTGYNAALLKELVGPSGHVTSIELDPELAQRARRALSLTGHRCRVLVGDGRTGAPDQAPFDRIIVTASAPGVPRAWRDQLVEGGMLEVPLWLDSSCFGLQNVATFRREGELLRSVRVLIGGFMALRDPGPGRPPPVVPGLQVVARKGSSETLVSIEGPFVRSLSKATIRRVLATMLGRPRLGRRFTFRAADGLIRFLAWSDLRRAGFCSVGGRYGIVTLSADGNSAAAVLAQPFRSGWIETWGDRRAEEELDSRIQQWERAGQPTLEDLEIMIGYGRPRGRGWKTLKGQDGFIRLDWTTRLAQRRRSESSEAPA
jgi:SAM-dependent methyltransferase